MDSRDVGPGRAILEVDYRERRHRWALLQVLIGYPQLVVLALATLPLLFSVVFAWFSLVLTGRLPEFHRRWMGLWLAAAIRVWAYLNLIVDTYPGWRLDTGPSYPVRLVIGPTKPRYSRVKALLRILYIIPAWFAAAVGGLINYVLILVSGLVILFSGRQPRTLFQTQRTCLAWYASYGLLANLVTEDYDFTLEPTAG